MIINSEVQVSYDLAREDNSLTAATIQRVFENGFKVLAIIDGEDAEAFIDAWNARAEAGYRYAFEAAIEYFKQSQTFYSGHGDVIVPELRKLLEIELP